MPKAVRHIRVEGDIAFIQLTKGYVAAIDVADVALAEGRNWSAFVKPNTVYAQSKIGKRTIYMHRVIAGDPCGLQIDHIDGDGLNNRRSNLRPATVVQNLRNQRLSKDSSSGFKGVTKYASKGWAARIKIDGKRLWLGLHDTPEAAHAAYVAASIRFHEEFGRHS